MVLTCDICHTTIALGPRAHYADEDENTVRISVHTSHAISIPGDGAIRMAGTAGVRIDRDVCLICAPAVLAPLGMVLTPDDPARHLDAFKKEPT